MKSPSKNELDLLKWVAYASVGLYLVRKFQAQGILGSFDADTFVEEGAQLIPAKVAQHPTVKKLAKDLINAKINRS
jgi:hypothetical protein